MLDPFNPAHPPPPRTTFRAQIQPHTHWVNDILLSADGQTLISCSSDLAVKLWRPGAALGDAAETLGRHSDYVKVLAAPRDFAWVASGGLDRKVRIWDVAGGGEVLRIDVGDEGANPKGSVYALGVGGEGGRVLASGGPEAVVRLWDPRSGQRITKFVGHTDNVRCILVSEDGSLVLTASSDTTVKLWSLAERRVITTLNMHNDSVWNLASNHPRLEVFHSSDRSGLVAKTDLRNISDIDEGTCLAVCQESSGVAKVLSCGDYFWTATSSSSINRWLDVDTAAADINRMKRNSVTGTRPRGLSSPVASPLGSPTMQVASPASSSRRSPIPTGAILRLSAAAPAATNVRDPDAVTIYSVTSAQRRNSMAESALDVDPCMPVPICETPQETIQGHHGLIKHVILPDRRHVLTLDTSGEVVRWDLLQCRAVENYGRQDLEVVAYGLQSTEAVANWCTVNTRTGALTVVLEENQCFEAEAYADSVEGCEGIEFREDQRSEFGVSFLLCVWRIVLTMGGL